MGDYYKDCSFRHRINRSDYGKRTKKEMSPEMHKLITQFAGLLGVDWHDRQNRVIFTTNEKKPRRVYMFRINSRDGVIRVFINDLVLDSTESKMIIDMCDMHSVHNNEQITTGFYNTCDFTFESFLLCLQALRKRLMSGS